MNALPTPDGNIIFKFESQTEITEYTNSRKYKKNDTSFVGENLATWEEVKARTVAMWEAGMTTLEMFVERLRQVEIKELKSHKRSIVWGTSGDELDVEKMMAGDVNCWKSYVREASTGPTSVTVIIDTTTPYTIDSEDILWRGAAAIALTKILEEKGYSVELWVVNGSTLFAYDRKGVMTACCLKRTSDPLDSSTLVNTVAGWFYRTVIFTLLETICEKTGKEVAMGYGSCHSPTAKDLDQVSTDILRIYASGVFTFNGAVSLIESELDRISEESSKVETKDGE